MCPPSGAAAVGATGRGPSGPLVAGIDSSTQSCKVVIVDTATGAIVRHGRAAHPAGTEVDPEAWWSALQAAVSEAGGLDDVAAVSVAGQQHGMVCLDEAGQVVRPALLWNDTRSGPQAAALSEELGAQTWAEAVGSVPVASFTITKLRWLAEHEPESARRTTAVCLPHDWLTWRLRGGNQLPGPPEVTTDRSDASGTGYWSPATGAYRLDLLAHAFGRELSVPRVVAPDAAAGRLWQSEALLAAGAGDNAAAALGLGAQAGDVVVSLGTSGVATAVSQTPAADPSGAVAGFADATGRFLPLVCTLNAAQVLDAARATLGVSFARFDELALAAPAGSDGLVLVPYLTGERTPNLPDATGSLVGLTLTTMSPGHLARATVEGMLHGLADALEALLAQGAACERILLIGGAAASSAVRAIAPTVFGRPVSLPAPGEYVAYGAARQAAWAWSEQSEPPQWTPARVQSGNATPAEDSAPDPDLHRRLRKRYHQVTTRLYP